MILRKCVGQSRKLTNQLIKEGEDMKRKECLVFTTDDWCPNYPDDQVLLSLSKLNTGNYRVAVWGQDDLGYDIDIQDTREACSLYHELKERGVVSYEYLTTKGLQPF